MTLAYIRFAVRVAVVTQIAVVAVCVFGPLL